MTTANTTNSEGKGQIIERMARAMASKSGWMRWDTATTPADTPNGNDPEVERDYWRDMARAALSAAPAAGAVVAWAAIPSRGARAGRIYTTCDTREQIDAYIQQVHQSNDSLTLWARPISFSDAASQGSETQHADDAAVDRFAAAIKAKLAKERSDGGGDLEGKAQCSGEYLSSLLRQQLENGDPVDVGSFAMMLHHRDERIPALRVLVTEGDEEGDVFEYKVIEGQDACQSEATSASDADSQSRDQSAALTVRETTYNIGFADGLEVAAVVVNNLRSNGLSTDLSSIVASLRALKGQHAAHPAGGVVAWLDPNGDPFCNVITAVWKERLVGIESHDGFEREHAAKHTVALTYAALQSSSSKDAKQQPTAWKVFDAGLNKHYLTEHPRVAQILREEGGNIVKDLFEHPSFVDRETDRNFALEEAAQLCDAEAEEWESDAVVTEKNYAQAAARRIRSLVRAVPSEGGTRVVAFAGDEGHGKIPAFVQVSKDLQ